LTAKKGKEMKRLLLPIIVVSLLVGCGQREPSIDIWTAAATGETGVIKQHVAFGTDIDAREPAGGSPPLIVAALFGQTEVVEVLVEHGAEVDAMNNDSSTALHVAAFFCHPETVSYLLEQGADLDKRNKFGHTPLDTVSGQWSNGLEGTYTMFADMLNLDLDLERIREVRPQVAELLRRHVEGR